MTDEEWIKSLDKISDPVDALRTLLKEQYYLTNDPYYRDIREALMQMVERIVATHDKAG
jgi:hypothetical protein